MPGWFWARVQNKHTEERMDTFTLKDEIYTSGHTHVEVDLDMRTNMSGLLSHLGADSGPTSWGSLQSMLL